MTSDLARAPVDEIHANDGNLGTVYYGDNLPILRKMAPESIDLIYTDPPFNTGRTQSRTSFVQFATRMETEQASRDADIDPSKLPRAHSTMILMTILHFLNLGSKRLIAC